MFSSDPFAIAAAAGVGRHAIRPSILTPAALDALDAHDGGAAVAWMPDTIPVLAESFDALADFGDEPAPPPATRPDVEAAVRAALATREAQELEHRAQLQAEAFAAGAAAGRAQVEAEARQALATAIEALWLATEEVRASEARWLGALQDNVVALSVSAARHVVGRELGADDTLVRALAARAIAEFPQDHPIHVRVNPTDLATLRDTFEAPPARAGDIRWTADPRVERGGCVIEGRERIVDGRVDTALERIYRALSGHHA